MRMQTRSVLGARLFGEPVADLDSATKILKQILPLTGIYSDLLSAFGGAVVFENGAKFRPDEKSKLNDQDGYQSLEILYGPGNGPYSVAHHISKYQEQLPQGFVPVGEAPGGNLLCLDTNGIVYLWDHESLLDEPATRVALSIDELLERLEPDEPTEARSDAVIEAESFLDF